MRNLILKLKMLGLVTGVFTLFSSQAATHPMPSNESAMSHAFMALDHSLSFIFLGILTATLMLSRKRLLILLGNCALLAFLIYQAFLHMIDTSLISSIEFFLSASLIALTSWRATYLLIPTFNWVSKNLRIAIYGYFKSVDKYVGFPDVKAHCDIPCKIYDPAIATVAALSVIRLIDIINENDAVEDKSTSEYQNTMARCIQRKEEESEKLKQEIRIIWGDYFKKPQFETFPEIHNLTHQIMVGAGAAKQTIDRKEALSLLELVNNFAEIFWATKGIDTERKTAPYPPSLEVVRPKL
jgi:nickel superoxide dismutase